MIVVGLIILSCDINQTDKKSFNEISDGGITLLPESGSKKFIVSDLIDNVIKGKVSDVVSWSEIETIIESAKAQTSRELVAVFSVRDSTGNWYNYFVQPLGFSPEAMEESSGETQLFIYELDPDSLNSVPRIAVASIPKGDHAYSEMEAWINPQIENQVQSKLIDLNSNYIQDDFYCDYQQVVPGGISCSTWEGVTECSHYFPIYDTVCYGGSDGSSIWNWPSNGGGGSNDGSSTGNCEPPHYCGTPDEAIVEDDFEVIDLTVSLELELQTLENQYKDRMTTSELKIYNEELNIFQKVQYLKSALDASNESERLFNGICDLTNGKGDSFRHAFWNALSTIRIGEDLTERLTTAHEDWEGNPELIKKMDLHNNSVGRAVAVGTTNDSISNLIMTALTSGELVYITNPNVFQNCAPSDSSELKPTDQ